MTQMLELANEDIKAVIIIIFLMPKSWHMEDIFNKIQIELLDIKTIICEKKNKLKINSRVEFTKGKKNS